MVSAVPDQLRLSLSSRITYLSWRLTFVVRPTLSLDLFSPRVTIGLVARGGVYAGYVGLQASTATSHFFVTF